MTSRQEEPERLDFEAERGRGTQDLSDTMKKSQNPDANEADPFGNEEEGVV